MITEDYCSYEVAKLLKEKGFDAQCRSYFINDLGDYRKCAVGITNRNCSFEQILRPTLQMAMKWLREKHDLHIIAYPFKIGNDTFPEHWCCYVYKTFNLLGHERYFNETLNSYEEAVEAALKYSLENLI